MSAFKRAAIVIAAALVVAVPGALVIRFWPRVVWPGRASQAPSVPLGAVAESGAPNPLASFDLREVGRGAARVKLWATPPESDAAYGVEFVGKGDALSAVVSRRGAAERTPVPMPAGWVDRLNAAIRRPAQPASGGRAPRGIAADLVVEKPGEVPEKYEVRFDPEGPGWAVLDEILSHYGLASYTVKKGDTPAKIAKQLLGDSRRWGDILAVNPGLKPERMRPGDVIHVPKK